MSDLRKMARDAGFNTEFDDYVIDHWKRFEKFAQLINAAALAQPDEAFCDMHCTWHQHHPDCFMARTEKGPVTYTDDVTRIMRDARITFHLGLPHKAVIEQMTRVVDLVCAEASIKAAQKFATPPQRKPLTEEEIAALSEQHIFASRLTKFVRAIERAHGIGGHDA